MIRMFCGPIVSTVFCVFFATVVLLTDTIHVLFQIVESKRYHASMIRNLFGPLIGVKHMDKFHGYLMGLWMAPLVVAGGVWRPSHFWAVTSVTLMATAQPYFLLYACFLRTCDLKVPSLPILYAAIFGLVGVVWRAICDRQSYFRPKFLPVITLWHAIVSSLVAWLVYRMTRRIDKLRATLELEKVKADAVRRGKCSWPDAELMPQFLEGYEPYPVLVETAERELEELDYLPVRKVISVLLLLTALLLWGFSESQIYVKILATERIQKICLLFITLPLMLLGLLLTFLYISLSHTQPPFMFDNVEGHRSFSSSMEASSSMESLPKQIQKQTSTAAAPAAVTSKQAHTETERQSNVQPSMEEP